ncbi:MAG: hypothetical protein AB7T38_06445 [Nitrospirales bacterium]
MNSRTPFLYVPLVFLLMALVYACTIPQPTQTTGVSSSIMQIDRETHFLTPAGEDVVVFPGAYLVKAEKEGLRLIAEEGTGSESLVIEATSQTHDQKLSGPTALSISEQEDEQVVLLLLPDGKGWEATGSHSGVISRAAPRPKTPQSRIRQVINMKNKVLIPKQALILSAMSVRYATLDKTFQGSQNRTSWRLPVSDTVDNASFTFVWSGAPTPPTQIPEINQIVKNKGCCLTLFLDNQPHTWTPPPPSHGGQPLVKTSFTASSDRGGNLITTVHLANARSKQWPKNIRLAIASGKNQWQSTESKVYANAVSYYASELHPIFSHERCTTCHSLGDRPAIVAMHESRLGAGAYPDVEDARPHNPDFCGGCHNIPPGSDHTDVNLNNEWFSPAAVQGINWQGWDAGLVCNKVTGPFTNKDGVTGAPFDAQTFHHHFHDDPRILWAVSSGWVPFGRPDLAVPMKNNLQGWFNKVDPWVEAGTPCPQSLFFQIPGRIQPGQLTIPPRHQ